MTVIPMFRPHEEPEDDGPSIDAGGDVRAQTNLAEAALHREPEEWLRLPWPSLDAMVDGIGAGDVWFVGGFSGAGKTTWLMNLVADLLAKGERVYYVGTETMPHEIRTRLACIRQGVYAGDVLSGKAARTYQHWPEVRAKLVADIARQRTCDTFHEFLVCPVQRVHAGILTGAYRDAQLQQCSVLIFDHIDHAEHGQGRSGFEDSKKLAHLVLDLSQGTKVRTIVATQFNNEGSRADLLGPFRPPQPHHVYMGGHKRQIAWGMLGLYRPLRDDLTPDDIKTARLTGKVKHLLQPNVLAVSCMKHRHHGAHEGDLAFLAFDRGRLRDLPEKDRHATTYDALRRV